MADVLQTLADAPAPTDLPNSPDLRRARIERALAQIKESGGSAPIQSWTQGLARLADAGFGGYDLYRLTKEDRDQQKAYRDLQDQDPRLSTGGAPSPQDRVATALAGTPEPKPAASANYMTGGLPGANAITPIQTPGGLRANVHKDAAPAFTGFLSDLEAAGAPISSVGSYNQRKIAGSDKWSQHAYGNAIDIDQTGRNATAQAFQQWAQANPDKLAELERRYGMTGGRNFSNPDFGHWEWNGSQGGLTPPAQREAAIGAPMPPAPAPQVVPSARPGAPAAAPAPVPEQAPGAPAASPQPAAAAPAAPVPQAAAPGTPTVTPTQVNRMPTQMTPEIAQYIRQLRATNNPAAMAQAEALTQQYSKPTEYDFKVAGDKLYKTDKLGNVVPVADANKVPNAIEEVQYAQKNWKSLGFPDPASPDPKAQQFWRQLSGNRLSGVSTMIDQRAPDAFESHYGEGMAKQALSTIDAGNAAVDQGRKIQLAQKMLQDIQTGKITPTTSTVGAWMQAIGIDPARFGINPTTPMTAEALSALSNEMALGKIGSGGMPANNFSDADRKFLQQTVTSLADRPEANFIKLEMARRVNELQADKANAWADARDSGLSYEKFERQWRKDTQQKDVFGDLIEKAKAFGQQPGQQGGPIDQPKMREGVQSVIGSDEYRAAIEAAKKRGWKIPGVTP